MKALSHCRALNKHKGLLLIFQKLYTHLQFSLAESSIQFFFSSIPNCPPCSAEWDTRCCGHVGSDEPIPSPPPQACDAFLLCQSHVCILRSIPGCTDTLMSWYSQLITDTKMIGGEVSVESRARLRSFVTLNFKDYGDHHYL